MSSPVAAVFDIGNVLLHWRPERMYDDACGPETRARLFAEVDLGAMNLRVDRGGDLASEVGGLAARHPDWAPLIALWHDRWSDMLGPAIAGSVTLLRRLRKRGVPVFALSNFGAGTFRIARRDHDFLNEFDAAFISGELGVVKPDAAIYEVLERDTGLKVDQIVFADDNDDNVSAARARGWRAHRFRSAAGWGRFLAGQGLLSDADARV